MKKLFATLAMLALVLLPGAAFAQAQQDFQLINNTGYTINEIYVGSSADTNWGRDLLGANVLRDGQTFNVRFAAGTQGCLWDIRIVYEDGDNAEMRQINLCQVSRIFLTWDDAADATRYRTE